ncbi:voltage-dependent calcium channel gamma-7 subunit isoform X2 [Brachyhypopomus gauderio]|uniref:voltage-dependent calcium channel gamma-7 subunit isoform X2 n=1 Tax=Brachyhypopomus gauderio TaxID=698409 RepID=UPI004042DA33
MRAAVGRCCRGNGLLAADGGRHSTAAEPNHRRQDGAALWPVEGSEKGRCVASEYFTEPENEITTENTANILKMVQTATPFPMVSLLFVFMAFVISNVGHIRPQRTILAFISGILFILSGLSLVVGLVLYISSINDEVMNRPREPELFFNYHYGWSFAFAASSFLLKEGAGVMSVYLFMKRYAEEEMYRPHPALYRPRMSESSDYSGQFLHPETWPPPKRARSASELSSDISIQLTQNPQPLPKVNHQPPTKVIPQQSAPSASMTAASSPTSDGGYDLASASSASAFPLSHPLLPGAAGDAHGLGLVTPPPAVPPPQYHTHMRMSASPY